MKAYRLVFPLAVLLLLITSASVAALPNDQSIETLRCDLDEFLTELEAVPGLDIDLELASTSVDQLTPEQVEQFHTRLRSFGNWRQLPVILAGLADAKEEYAREKIARALSEAGVPGLPEDHDQQLENFRADFLFFLDQLERFVPLMDAEYAHELAALRSDIEAAPIEAIAAFHQQYLENAMSWQLTLAGVGSGSSGANSLLPDYGVGSQITPMHTPDCDKDCCAVCVDCWIAEAVCWASGVTHVAGHVADLASDIATFVDTFFNTTLPNLVGKISSLPGEVASFFTNVFDTISTFVTDQFNALVALLPGSVNEVLTFLGIDPNNMNWASIASSIPTITPPCPQQAVDIAADVCDRGGDALTQILFDLAPDDGLSFLFKVGVAVIHYPLTYLCQCNDIQEAIAFADAQATHRQLTSTNLDLKLSTRASQSSVNALSLALADLDSDVASVEAKIDTIEATAGVIETKTSYIESTTNRIETNVDTIEATTDRSHEKVDQLTEGNANQQEFIADFDELMTRLNIETNLLENRPDVVSWFQLPTAFGGMLETVALIAADTIQLHIAAGQNVSRADVELERGDELLSIGDFVRAYEAYRSAYIEAVK